MADRVRSKLGESAQSRESYQVPTSRATTLSLDALKASSMGDYFVSQGQGRERVSALLPEGGGAGSQVRHVVRQIGTDYYTQAELNKDSLYSTKAFQLSG